VRSTTWKLNLGASLQPHGFADFRVWAPRAQTLAIRISARGDEREILLTKNPWGYFEGSIDGVCEGDRYFFRLDGEHDFPDPVSRFQPEGVHGASAVVDPGAFAWTDSGWTGIPMEQYVIYELHVGTFTPEGNFDAVIPRLDTLADLGVTAVELMPVAQFPGTRNWGYDGSYPYAPQNSYGGPSGLKRLVDACHARGLAVVLDVVHNHLGPEGNYLGKFGPYFTDRYRTPWGQAINFDGPHGDEVRHYFVSNACYWLAEYHVDALRIDAIHGIFDFSANHFLRELGEAVHLLATDMRRQVYVISESDLNDVRVISPPELGGYGLDAQWNDDFHHALHTLLTDERNGYYEDFGELDQLAAAYREGFVYTGQHSRYRKRRHGNSSKGRPATQFVVFSQNHDQVGNRLWGDRLSTTVSFEKLKLAAAVVLLSPFIPLIFMGEEYGEEAPFRYFVSHSDPDLIEAVRNGRRKEFVAISWQGDIPDPQAEETFRASVIDWNTRTCNHHGVLLDYYRELIRVRNAAGGARRAPTDTLQVVTFEADRVLSLLDPSGETETLHAYGFGEKPARVSLPFRAGRWKKVFDSSAQRWLGKGETGPAAVQSTGEPIHLDLNPHSVVLYQKTDQ
jgi:maltooligosyltrehalose trehalohydrolase